MEPIAKQSNKKRAFTIVELLTVMSIIIILMGLLAPVMNKVRRYARKVSQKNQFHSINLALELFRAEFDGLCIDPQLPKAWKGARVQRRFRGATFEITIKKSRKATDVRVVLDGEELPENMIPVQKPGTKHTVVVTVPA